MVCSHINSFEAFVGNKCAKMAQNMLAHIISYSALKIHDSRVYIFVKF
jgi:hypothetical protein